MSSRFDAKTRQATGLRRRRSAASSDAEPRPPRKALICRRLSRACPGLRRHQHPRVQGRLRWPLRRLRRGQRRRGVRRRRLGRGLRRRLGRRRGGRPGPRTPFGGHEAPRRTPRRPPGVETPPLGATPRTACHARQLFGDRALPPHAPPLKAHPRVRVPTSPPNLILLPGKVSRLDASPSGGFGRRGCDCARPAPRRSEPLSHPL